MITIQGVHHVKLPVSDLSRSRTWYESVLPLTPRLEFPDDTGTIRGVAHQPLAGFTVALREDPDRARALAGYNPLALQVASPADLDDIATHLDHIGVGHGPVTMATLGWLMTTTDPDGIELRFYTAAEHSPQDTAGTGKPPDNAAISHVTPGRVCPTIGVSGG